MEADGLAPASVRWVCLSHLHTDHAGRVDAFPAARVLVAREEWERARGFPGRVRGYLPHRWPRAVEPELVDLSGPAVGPFPRSYDVAGDGRLRLVPLPGHTPGHVGLLVDARLLLAGDAEEVPPGFRVLRAHEPCGARLEP